MPIIDFFILTYIAVWFITTFALVNTVAGNIKNGDDDDINELLTLSDSANIPRAIMGAVIVLASYIIGMLWPAAIGYVMISDGK